MISKSPSFQTLHTAVYSNRHLKPVVTAQLLIRIRTNLRFGAFDFVKRPDGQIIFPRNEPEWSVHLIRKSWLERKNLFQTFDHKTELERLEKKLKRFEPC